MISKIVNGTKLGLVDYLTSDLVTTLYVISM